MSKTYSISRPYTPIDIINRRAAATGSVRYARASADANYNGHRVSVSFKPHAVSGPTWNAEYWWAGRRVLGRGRFDSCLQAAMSYFERDDRGATVVVCIDSEAPESIEDQCAACEAAGLSQGNGHTGRKPAWWTGTHEAVSDALNWEKHGVFVGIVDHALQFEGSPDEWPAAREAWLEDFRARRR